MLRVPNSSTQNVETALNDLNKIGVSPKPGLLNLGDKEVDEDEEIPPGISDDESDKEVIGKNLSNKDEDSDSGGEAEESIGIVKPCRPSEEEVEAHNRTHFPFRNWCEVCVKGRCQEDPHRSSDGDKEYEVPVVSLDYCYLNEEKGSKVKPILAIKCHSTKTVTANMVPSKGGDCELAIKSAQRDIEKIIGHKKIVLRSDQEPAIVDLKNKLKKILRCDVIIEETPVGDSKSAGSIENANKQIQAIVRTYKLALEARLKCEIPEDHVIIGWLVKHAAANRKMA